MNTKYLNKIILGDSLDVLPTIKDDSIDLVLTDPPYFLDKMDDKWEHQKVSDKKNQYVIKSLPAGMKFDRTQGTRFYDWYLNVSREIFRVLKPGGFFFSFSSPRLYHRMASAIDDVGFNIRDSFLWIYTQNQVKAMGLNHFIDKMPASIDQKTKLKKKLEGWKTPQIKSCYEPIAVAQKPPDNNFLSNILKHDVGLFNTNIRIGNNMYPSNILVVDEIDDVMDKYFLIKKPTKKQKSETNGHQTVKPLSLCKYLIGLAAFSKNAVILDPFVGSGTTAIAAKELGFKYIGIDINEEYIEIANNRLKHVQPTIFDESDQIKLEHKYRKYNDIAEHPRLSI